MSTSLRLDVRQSQTLVMTPQLQQAIKLLQLPNLELSAFVQQEIEQNPFLEPIDGAGATTALSTAEAGDPDTPGVDPDPGASSDWSAEDEGWPDQDRDSLPGLGIERLTPPGRGTHNAFDDEAPGFETRLSRPKSLREHLLEQLHMDVPAGPDRLIGLHLIDLVDEAGYLGADLEEVAGRLGCSTAQVEAVLCRLQEFDPPGVCARSLKECLALQLRDADRLDPAMAILLEHLDLVARADFAPLVRLCGLPPDDVAEMIAEIKRLDPKPGLAFANEPVEAVVPDIFILPTRNGGWRVELNSATLPRVLVNKAYYVELTRGPGRDRRARRYASERFQSANWLVKALEQRARTVLKVAEAVVERQLPFLNHGVRYLRPLILRDIAEATGLHESTVSRATADKYVATPRGNFLFRYFFSNAIPGTGGESSHSAEAIRQQIKEMIESEDPEHVLSDDQIVAALRRHGVAIARRTVAKYRESLAIPSSVQRRRAKALRLA